MGIKGGVPFYKNNREPKEGGFEEVSAGVNGGVDGTRTRDLRRDRPAF